MNSVYELCLFYLSIWAFLSHLHLCIVLRFKDEFSNNYIVFSLLIGPMLWLIVPPTVLICLISDCFDFLKKESVEINGRVSVVERNFKHNWVSEGF